MENKFQIFLSVFTLGLLIFLVVNKPMPSLGSLETSNLTTFTHSTTSIAATGKNTVLAANSARSYAIIRNTSSTAVCYLTFADTTSTSAGYYLVNAEYKIDYTNQYKGKITGICSPAMTLQLIEAY